MKNILKSIVKIEPRVYICVRLAEEASSINADVAQLVEHDLAKVGVAGSSLVIRSKKCLPPWRHFLFPAGLPGWWNR